MESNLVGYFWQLLGLIGRVGKTLQIHGAFSQIRKHRSSRISKHMQIERGFAAELCVKSTIMIDCGKLLCLYQSVKGS